MLRSRVEGYAFLVNAAKGWACMVSGSGFRIQGRAFLEHAEKADGIDAKMDGRVSSSRV